MVDEAGPEGGFTVSGTGRVWQIASRSQGAVHAARLRVPRRRGRVAVFPRDRLAFLTGWRRAAAVACRVEFGLT